MDTRQQKRTREIARKLVIAIRSSQAPHVWTRRSVILAHNTTIEHMPVTEDELNNDPIEGDCKIGRIQTRKIEGITYLRAQPRLDGNHDERYAKYPPQQTIPNTNHSKAHLETPTAPTYYYAHAYDPHMIMLSWELAFLSRAHRKFATDIANHITPSI